MIIGVTGGIGSGKSTVCEMFKSLGVPTISADSIAKRLLETDPSIMQAVKDRFGTMDRRVIREKIFNSSTDRIWLEQLLHPLIKQEIFAFAKNVQYPYCIVEIPLLVETNMQDLVDRVLTVDCPEEVQVSRASQRDNYSKKDILAIMDSQTTRGNRLANSVDVIENNSKLENLYDNVKDMHKFYLSLGNNVL